MTNLRSFMTVQEAATYLGVSVNTLRNWGRNGRIKERRHPVNRYRLYKKVELDQLLTAIDRPGRQSWKAR
jgi:excisionase family DNA binding protein